MNKSAEGWTDRQTDRQLDSLLARQRKAGLRWTDIALE